MTNATLDRRRWVRKLSCNSGQSLLELALVAPLLVVILMGVAEVGRLAYAAIEVSNAASAGARYGAQNGATASDSTGISNAAANDAGNLTGLSTISSISCICSDGTAASCTDNSACSTSNIEESVTVNTQVSFDPGIHLPGLPKTFTLTGQAIQKCLQ
ncbi:MAG: TadE/TadG family type IV pilus assembly protein [Alloacidobacterium sp.]|jgi:Flp pilus assembly protein TadG